jgi:RHS repeat-associated protein
MGRHFLWDPIEDNIVEEFDDAGNTIADYTTEPFLHGDVISQHRGGQSRFYHFDGQGNTTSLTDANGNVTDTYAYNAFGEVTERTGSTVNPFQFVGQKGYYHDPATGDLIVRRRPLSAGDGKWRSPDPAGVAEDPNLYRYAANNPISRFDPSGLKCVGYAGPVSPTFAKETWFARIEGDSCGKREGEEGAYKVVLTFWAYDSVKKVCNDDAAAFIRRHRLGALQWQWAQPASRSSASSGFLGVCPE